MTALSVLVTDGGSGASRSALATVRALGAAGHRPTLTTSNGRELAASSRFTADVVDVPPAAETDAYRMAIDTLKDDRAISIVFATSDDALIALDPVAAAFVDKGVLATRLEQHGITTPQTQVFESSDALLAADIVGSMVVKPVTGAAPAVRFEAGGDADLLDVFDGPVVAQPFLTGTVESVSGVVWNGTLRAAIHQRYERTWPIDCGTASYAKTVAPDQNRESLLTSLLSEHQGIFQAQYIAGALIDINPRPYGSMPLALQAGVNLPGIVCDLASHGTAPSLPMVRAKVGVAYRWIEGDLRHLFGSVRAGEIGPIPALMALRPVRGTAHSLLARGDLRPVAARASTVLRALGRSREA